MTDSQLNETDLMDDEEVLYYGSMEEMMIVKIQANVRGFLVRQEIRRQLLEIYEYEQGQLQYLKDACALEDEDGNQIGDLDDEGDENEPIDDDGRSTQVVAKERVIDNEKAHNNRQHQQYQQRNIGGQRSSQGGADALSGAIETNSIALSETSRVGSVVNSSAYQLYQGGAGKKEQKSERQVLGEQSLLTSSIELEKKVNQKLKQHSKKSPDSGEYYQISSQPKIKNVATVTQNTATNAGATAPFPKVRPIYSNSQIQMQQLIEHTNLQQQKIQMQMIKLQQQQQQSQQQQQQQQQQHVQQQSSYPVRDARFTDYSGGPIPQKRVENGSNSQKMGLQRPQSSNNNNHSNYTNNSRKMQQTQYQQQGESDILVIDDQTEGLDLSRSNSGFAKISRIDFASSAVGENTQMNSNPNNRILDDDDNDNGENHMDIIVSNSNNSNNLLFQDECDEAQYHLACMNGGAEGSDDDALLDPASFMHPSANNDMIIDQSVFLKNMAVIQQMQMDQLDQSSCLGSALNTAAVVIAASKKSYLMQQPEMVVERSDQMRVMSKGGVGSANYNYNYCNGKQNNQNRNQRGSYGKQFGTNEDAAGLLQSYSSSVNNRSRQANNNNNNGIVFDGYKGQSLRCQQSGSTPVNAGWNVRMFEFDIFVQAATMIQKCFRGWSSRKHVCEFRKCKRAALIIEAKYLQFKHFLVKRMKECANQIDCGSYAIIKMVRDFEKGERQLRMSFRKKAFETKVAAARENLCKVFIEFINASSDDNGNSRNDRGSVTGKSQKANQIQNLQHENLVLQKNVIKLQTMLQKQSKSFKEEIQLVEEKYSQLKDLHKETIRKYIAGIQNLAKKRSSSNGNNSNQRNSNHQNNQRSHPNQNNYGRNSAAVATAAVVQADQNQFFVENNSPRNKNACVNNFFEQHRGSSSNKQSGRKHCEVGCDNESDMIDQRQSTQHGRSNRSPLQMQGDLHNISLSLLEKEALRDLSEINTQIKSVKYNVLNSGVNSNSDVCRKQGQNQNTSNRNSSQLHQQSYQEQSSPRQGFLDRMGNNYNNHSNNSSINRIEQNPRQNSPTFQKKQSANNNGNIAPSSNRVVDYNFPQKERRSSNENAQYRSNNQSSNYNQGSDKRQQQQYIKQSNNHNDAENNFYDEREQFGDEVYNFKAKKSPFKSDEFRGKAGRNQYQLK